MKLEFLLVLTCLKLDQLCLKSSIPSVHTLDLPLVFTLTRASRQVSLSPFTVSSSQLFNCNRWILTVVTVNIKIKFTSVTVSSWTTMGKIISIIVSTALITTLEVTLHSTSISFECINPKLFFFPSKTIWKEGKPCVHNLLCKLIQTRQTLKRVSWWDLLVIGSG